MNLSEISQHSTSMILTFSRVYAGCVGTHTRGGWWLTSAVFLNCSPPYFIDLFILMDNGAHWFG